MQPYMLFSVPEATAQVNFNQRRGNARTEDTEGTEDFFGFQATA